jgi:hypothetical protein
MGKGLLFWILMIMWLFLGMWSVWPVAGQPNQNWRPVGGNLLLWILLFIVGWAVFGFVVH